MTSLRPIGTAFDRMTLGAENYINKLLSPLQKTCTYAINSQMAFKNEFLKVQPIFDSRIDEIFTFDVTSLFPNINNTCTVNFILNGVFKDPTVYFLEKSKKWDLLPPPTRDKFRKFLHGCLNSFNIFHCQIGTKKGVKIGSPHSSLFADLFLGMFERTLFV